MFAYVLKRQHFESGYSQILMAATSKLALAKFIFENYKIDNKVYGSAEDLAKTITKKVNYLKMNKQLEWDDFVVKEIPFIED